MQTPRDDQAIGRGVLKASAVGCLGGLSARRTWTLIVRPSVQAKLT